MGKNFIDPKQELITDHPWSRRRTPMTRRELITWAVVCLSVVAGMYFAVTWYIHYSASHLPEAKPTCYSAEAL